MTVFKFTLGAHGKVPAGAKIAGPIVLPLTAGTAQTIDLTSAQGQGQSIECALAMNVQAKCPGGAGDLVFTFGSGQVIKLTTPGPGVLSGGLLNILQPNPILFTVSCSLNCDLILSLYNQISEQFFWKV